MAKAAAMCVVVVVAMAGRSTAQCNVGQGAVCAPAIIGGASPSAACCSNLRAQQGCSCQYALNPAYSRYINSPTSRRAIASCGITMPRC